MQDNNFNSEQWGQSPFSFGSGPDNNSQNDGNVGFSQQNAGGNVQQNQYGEQPQQNNYQQQNSNPFDMGSQQNSNPFDMGSQQTPPWAGGGQVTPPTPAWAQAPGGNNNNSYGFAPMRTAKKKKSKLPLIIAIIVSVVVIAAVAIVLAIVLGGGNDTEATTAAVVTTDNVATQPSGGNNPPVVVTTAATSSNTQVVTNPDGTKEVTYYAASGEILSKEFFDAAGNLAKTQTYLNGAMVSERRYENGKTVYALYDDGNTKTITTYNRDANGNTIDGSTKIYDQFGNILEEQILNPYENPVIIKYYSNGKLERTRTYIISAAGTRDGYVDEYVDGRRFKFDMQGNPIAETTTAATTTKKAETTTTSKPKPQPSGEYTDTTGWVNDRKVDTTYSASGAKIREVTYKKIGSREVEMVRYEYATTPKTKTEYNRHPSTGDVTRTIYWEFKQNPNNYTLYMIKDESGKITKYETYERDDNGKILKTFVHDTASGEVLYYIKHEAHGNYKYSPDGKYLGNA